MTLHRSSLATMTQATYRYVEESDLDTQGVFDTAGIDINQIFDANARIPTHSISRMWQTLVHRTGNPTLIYDVVKYIEPSMLHAMGHAWITSATLLEALQRFVRYHRMLSTNFHVSLERAQGTWQLVGNPIDPGDYQLGDGIIAFTLQMCRYSYGDDLCPLNVSVTRLEPRDAAPMKEFFGCDIEYGALENVMIFSTTDLQRRLRSANAAVSMAMEKVIQDYLAQYDASDVVTQARKVVAEWLVHGEPSKQDVADELNLSARTLQRRLEEQGSSLKEIIDETRKELALSYLDQGHYSIKEVAFNLGFTDPSNFSRAFKRWTGQTPKQYKKAH